MGREKKGRNCRLTQRDGVSQLVGLYLTQAAGTPKSRCIDASVKKIKEIDFEMMSSKHVRFCERTGRRCKVALIWGSITGAMLDVWLVLLRAFF